MKNRKDREVANKKRKIVIRVFSDLQWVIRAIRLRYGHPTSTAPKPSDLTCVMNPVVRAGVRYSCAMSTRSLTILKSIIILIFIRLDSSVSH